MEYNFADIEKKWKKIWEEKGIYKVIEDPSKPKYYVLDMFPYPSGAGLHVGHPLGYVASDIYARYKRLKGFNVLHPMGYDAFGLPAEQYAIETGTRPEVTTEKAIKRYREQLDKIGFSFDWSRQVKTSDPAYYKWTQWIFLKLFGSWYNREKNKAEPIETLIGKFTLDRTLFEVDGEDMAWDDLVEGDQQKILMQYRLAFLSYAEVNWCQALGTVLANDEVKDGKSERGGYPVERRKMRQWFLRITEYSDRLLEGLETLDWSESMKEMQRNWIGRSEGALIKFQISDRGLQIEQPVALRIFTTRPDTIFGATFMVIAPEHDLVEQLTTAEQKQEVETYLTYVKSRSDVERQQEKKVTGVFTGSYAINPFTGKEVPVWIAEYVLIGYGTGAIMAVPADDERDRKFAEKFGLPIVDIIDKSMYPDAKIEDKLGKMINSGLLNGLEVKDAIKKILDEIVARGIGDKKVNYKQRDAGFSRQRYWGEPFPIVLTPDPSPKERGAVWPGYLTGDAAAAKNIIYAKENRQNPTEAEENLWQSLRNKKLGDKFRRQHLIDKYIVDFVCLPKRLVIEVDGSIHDFTKEEDEARTGRLNELGFKVIRFTNDEVLKSNKDVLKRIKEELDTRTSIDKTKEQGAPPSPSERGVGGEDFLITPLPESELPLILPEVSSYKPSGDGSSPLANNKEWVAKHYETDTMPGYAASSWYFLRYMDAHNDKEFAAKDKIDYWQNVDIYFGGAEHAVGHLLYSRMWHKFLYDLGYVNTDEPFKKMVNQGMIQGLSAFTLSIGGFGIINTKNSKGVPNFKNQPIIYVSRNKWIKVNSDEKEGEIFLQYLDTLLKEYNPDDKKFERGKDKDYELSLDSISIAKIRANVQMVSLSDELNKEEFREWRKSWAGDTAIEFYLEDDKKYLCSREVEKMSKSKYNVVNPDDVIDKNGADCFRMFEMFLGPIEQSKPWDDKGISGVSNFLRKFWRLFYDEKGWKVTEEKASDAELKVLHKTLKKIADDIERLNFNTSVSAFMIATNELQTLGCNKREVLEPLLIALAPFAPFITEELWEKLGHAETIHHAIYPKIEEKYLVEDSHTYPVSINGKVRAQINFSLNISAEDIEKQILAMDKIKQWTNGNPPKKFIFVKGKIINVVV